MTIYQLPFDSSAETGTNGNAVKFITQIDSAKYQLVAQYNERTPGWTLDIYDAVTLEPIITCLALLLGSNLFAPFALALGQLIVNDEDGTGIDAGPFDLGNRIGIYWVTST